METPRVYVVHLRRPRSASVNPNEMRSDPFWEFGSFGCTGCHQKNLLNSKHAPLLEGSRLAFAQGGRDGFRLVYLTSPVKVHQHGSRFEILWDNPKMPFRYRAAPILVHNDGTTHVPSLKEMVSKANRGTIEGAFSSCFRSRTLPLIASVADELVRAYENLRSQATPADIAECYSEALPYPPPQVDKQRVTTYQSLIQQANSTNTCRSTAARPNSCSNAGPRSSRRC